MVLSPVLVRVDLGRREKGSGSVGSCGEAPGKITTEYEKTSRAGVGFETLKKGGNERAELGDAGSGVKPGRRKNAHSKEGVQGGGGAAV